MDENIKTWLWQHENYPNFPYVKDELTDLLSTIDYNRGLLDGISKTFAQEEVKELEYDVPRNLNTQIKSKFLKE